MIEKRNSILHAYHDEIGHWDETATRHFVSTRFWWPNMYHELHEYVRSCESCQKCTPLPKYKTSLRTPISSLFDVFSIDFAGPLPTTEKGNCYVLIAVEHLTGWHIARPTKDATADSVIDFVAREMIHSFGPPRYVVSDNANCFTAGSLQAFIDAHGIE